MPPATRAWASRGCADRRVLLELAELVEQRVVFVVADLGVVEGVVAAIVAGDLAPELLSALRRGLRAHVSFAARQRIAEHPVEVPFAQPARPVDR
jgi:hypothetical protein